MSFVNTILMIGKNNILDEKNTVFRRRKLQEINSKKMILVNTILMRGKNNILDKEKTVICG
jgi:hypothetical protein